MRELTRVERLRRRLEPGPRAVILLYHRLDDALVDPWRLAVSPGRFEEHLAVLRDGYRVLALEELVAALAAGRLPHRAVAVTFDDGYADNVLAGLPALERHGVPATIYVASGFSTAARELWWKRVEALLLEPGVLPERLEAGGRAWELGAAARYTEADARRHRDWTPGRLGAPDAPPAPTPRHAAFVALLGALAALPAPARDALLDELCEQAGAPAGVRPSHRMLAPDEVRAADAHPLLRIGAHTRGHPRLAELTPTAQAHEIRAGKQDLEALLDRPVPTFAYPFGEVPTDFTAVTASLVRAAGFTSAVAVRDLAVSARSPALAIPRVGIGDWPGEELERRLDWWLRRGVRPTG